MRLGVELDGAQGRATVFERTLAQDRLHGSDKLQRVNAVPRRRRRLLRSGQQPLCRGPAHPRRQSQARGSVGRQHDRSGHLGPQRSKAIFIEESYHITPTLKITAGARYSQDLKTFNTFNFSQVYDPGNVGCPVSLPVCDGAYAGFLAPQPANFHTDLTYLAHSTTPKLAIDWRPRRT